MSSAKTGDIVHVRLEGDQDWPAIVTAVHDDNQVEATVFAPGETRYFVGPLYGSQADGDKKRTDQPTYAFSGAPRAAEGSGSGQVEDDSADTSGDRQRAAKSTSAAKR